MAYAGKEYMLQQGIPKKYRHAGAGDTRGQPWKMLPALQAHLCKSFLGCVNCLAELTLFFVAI